MCFCVCVCVCVCIYIYIYIYIGSMTHQKETRRTNYGTNMNLDILPLVNPAYNRDVIFIRITVKAAYHVTKPTTIIMNITRVRYHDTCFYVKIHQGVEWLDQLKLFII